MRDIAVSTGQESPEKLIINLWKNADGVVFVRSVEMVDNVSRARFSFTNDAKLASIFTPLASDGLLEVIRKGCERPGLLMMSDYVIDLKDLILKGCRVLVTAVQNGVENIMIRFVSFYGRVKSLFRDSVKHTDALPERAAEHAMSVFERIHMPLRNFSYFITNLLAYTPERLPDDQKNFLTRIRDEIDGLSDSSNVITKFAASDHRLEHKSQPICINAAPGGSYAGRILDATPMDASGPNRSTLAATPMD
jgi:hypothetical protein